MYFVIFIDDFSKKTHKFSFKTKDEILGMFKTWKIKMELQSSKKVKYLRTNNGLEFCNREFNQYCRYCRVTRHRTVAYTPTEWTCKENESNFTETYEVYVNKCSCQRGFGLRLCIQHIIV